jgi:hypothetical protein
MNGYSPKIRLMTIPVIDNIKETDEDECFSLLSDRALHLNTDKTPERSHGALTTEQLLQNLKEETDFMNAQCQKEEEELQNLESSGFI